MASDSQHSEPAGLEVTHGALNPKPKTLNPASHRQEAFRRALGNGCRIGGRTDHP